jgi:predicted amidohydrolase YtcJ
MNGFADVIYIGGSVFTALADAPERMGVAVTGERIIAVGADAEIEQLAGPATVHVDLRGSLLAPGFQDAHIHPVSGGVELLQCNLSGAESAKEALAAIADYAAGHPDEEWILGGGWSMDHFPGGTPTRGALDAIVPDRPVLLSNRDHHGVWANTKAFELAGIDSHTADPADGRFEREPDGHPAGTVHEGAADLFNPVRPVIGNELALAGLLRAQQELISLGITGWQDAAVGAMFGARDILGTYRTAMAEGMLAARVVGALWWERDRGLEQLPGLLERRELIKHTGNGRFAATSVKIMVDGVAENFTAALLSPYCDGHGHETSNAGLSFIDPADLKTYVTALDANGFQVHFHAVGDRAVREALDAVEAARIANGPDGGRHHIAHVQVVASTDVPRFAALGVTVNMQALWACHEDQLDDLTLPFMEPDAVDHHYPFGEFRAAGAHLAAGSDWPVSSANPIDAIHVAVNRQSPNSAHPPLGPDSQKLDLATALRAYTAGTAYVNGMEGSTGAISPGLLADLVVLHPNPFDVDPAQIHATRVESTWIGGRLVHSTAPSTAS